LSEKDKETKESFGEVTEEGEDEAEEEQAAPNSEVFEKVAKIMADWIQILQVVPQQDLYGMMGLILEEINARAIDNALGDFDEIVASRLQTIEDKLEIKVPDESLLPSEIEDDDEEETDESEEK